MINFNLSIVLIGGLLGWLFFCILSKYFIRKQSNKTNENNFQIPEHSLLSEYTYAVVRIYEDVGENGFPQITIKPIAMCKNEEDAIEGAKSLREHEKKVAFSNPTNDISRYWKSNNIRAIKIY